MNAPIDWPMSLPTNWTRIPVRRLFRIVNGSTPKAAVPEFWNGDIAWATPDDLGSLSTDTIYETSRYISRQGYESCGTLLVPAGSVLISTRAPIGHVAIAGVPICTNQGCRALVPTKADVDARYFYYQFIAARKHLDARGMGSTFTELGRDRLAEFDLANPPAFEQRAISAFLDRKTAQIDALIAAYERLMALLEEKRQAVITQAVTKGLDPTVPMKNSGVEWLGEVPEHWGVMPVKRIAIIKYGLGEPPRLLEGGLLFIRATDIDNGRINMKNVQEVDPEDVPWSRDPQLRPGEILVVRSGAYTGDSAIVPDTLRGAIAGYDMVLSPSPKHSYPTFVSYVLQSNYVRFGQLEIARMRAAQPHLNAEELGATLIALPPIMEQALIAEYLMTQINAIEQVIACIGDALALTKEYRLSLITAAVTGQIDVTEEVTQDA